MPFIALKSCKQSAVPDDYPSTVSDDYPSLAKTKKAVSHLSQAANSGGRQTVADKQSASKRVKLHYHQWTELFFGN